MIWKKKLKSNVIFSFLLIGFFILPGLSLANSISLGQQQNFFIDSNYDFSGREKLTATLQRIGNQAYFYTDTQWWEGLDSEARGEVQRAIRDLDVEFSQKIYPKLTSTFGSEWNPGIDNSRYITILIHPMKKAAGYIRFGDEYSRIEVPGSNQREMIYLSSDFINTSFAPSYLAHEFTHLITFNQKNQLRRVDEEIWLNESRAEYAPTLLGYDNEAEEINNLSQRITMFKSNPFDCLTEWKNEEADYGIINIFMQYLVEHYGIEILSDSIKSSYTGIPSINYALEKNGFEKDFNDIFADWLIAVVANDCSIGDEYCYKSEVLEDLKIVASINFLPLQGQSSLAVSQTTKNWAGNWFKFVGGEKGALKIDFIGNPDNLFTIPYLVRDFSGNYSLDFFDLSEEQRGTILVSGFGSDISSVTIMPFAHTKDSGFGSEEKGVPFFWEASTIVEKKDLDQETNSQYFPHSISTMTQEELLSRISEFEQLLNQLKSQLAKIREGQGQEEDLDPVSVSCEKINNNLSIGMQGDEVRCLQDFLKSQGAEIYPEGLVTGYFGNLTKAAVIKFQEKYTDECLSSWGLVNGTGFVGTTTREKLNSLLGK